MKTQPLILAVIAGLSLAARAGEFANAVEMQIPSGPRLEGVLEFMDSSSGHWAGLQVQTSQADDSGFTGSFQPSSGTKTELQGTFEKSGNSLKCSLKWEGTTELPEAFIMLVFRLPVDSFQDGIILSGDRDISMAKILAGGPTRTSIDRIPSFTVQPIEGKTVSFSSDSAEYPLAVEVIKADAEFHVRVLLTPRKSPLPASGSAQWTMSAQ